VPRPLRLDFENALHHVTTRGNRRQLIFESADDFRLFLRLVGRVVKRFEWSVRDYCLLPNHFHLVVRTPKGGISRGMQLLNGRYAQMFNAFRGLDGHLFQGRFGSTLVEKHGHAVWLVRYLAMNPVEAGLCRDPGEWPWSGYGAFHQGTSPSWLARDEVFALFGSGERAVAACERLVLTPQ
jgi:REP element-mobilizing transposase RayT